MPEAFLFEPLSSKVNLAILNAVFTVKFANGSTPMKTVEKNLPCPHPDSHASKTPSVYLIMLTEGYFCQLKWPCSKRDSFTFTSLGCFSCNCQGCITQQSCMSNGDDRPERGARAVHSCVLLEQALLWLPCLQAWLVRHCSVSAGSLTARVRMKKCA